MVLDSNENCLVYGQIGKEGIPVPVGGVWGLRYVGIRTVGSEFFRSSQAMKQTGGSGGKGWCLKLRSGVLFHEQGKFSSYFSGRTVLAGRNVTWWPHFMVFEFVM